MVIQSCAHTECKKHGTDRYGNQRYRCLLCGATYIDRQPKPLGDMRISMAQAVTVIKMLLEGVSVRSIVRLTGISKNTILGLLTLVGDRCRQFANDRMNGIACESVQVDEIWGFVGCKEKTRTRLSKSEEFGDCYTFTAVDPTTKLLISWHCGKRCIEDAYWFAKKLADATVGRFQLTTDGFKPYATIIVEAFRNRVDFAQLIKIFGKPRNTEAGTYAPSEIKGTRRRVVIGNPTPKKVSTSIVERSNLTIRMRSRRMTRLTNGHSKKWQNHEAAMALLFIAYNFVTVHSTLKTTPAVAHGLATHPWSIEELLTELANHA